MLANFRALGSDVALGFSEVGRVTPYAPSGRRRAPIRRGLPYRFVLTCAPESETDRSIC